MGNNYLKFKSIDTFKKDFPQIIAETFKRVKDTQAFMKENIWRFAEGASATDNVDIKSMSTRIISVRYSDDFEVDYYYYTAPEGDGIIIQFASGNKTKIDFENPSLEEFLRVIYEQTMEIVNDYEVVPQICMLGD